MAMGAWTHEDGCPAGEFCSSTQAERVGLAAGLEFVRDELRGRGCRDLWIRVLCDSQPTLYNVRAGASAGGTESIVRIWRLLGDLLDDGHRVDMQYIPSHVGVAGNERADAMAERFGSAKGGRRLIPLDYGTVAALVRRRTRRAWLASVADGGVLSEILDDECSLNTDDLTFRPLPPKFAGFVAMGHGALGRAGLSVVAQVRTRHHPLLMDRGRAAVGGHFPAARCPDCSAPNSLEHLCWECPLRLPRWRDSIDGLGLRDVAVTRPELLLEYLWWQGWVAGRREDLFSAAYVAAVPVSPYA